MTMPQACDTAAPATLLGSEQPLCTAYDVALLDLDGVCFAGQARVPHAADNVNAAPGMSEQTLVNAIMARLNERSQAKQRRRNSSFFDKD